MCKIHGYHYACGHIKRHRFSRCLGHFTKPRRKDPDRILSCVHDYYLVIYSPSLCGNCLYDEFYQQWQGRIAEAEGAHCEALEREGKLPGGMPLIWGTPGEEDEYGDEDGDELEDEAADTSDDEATISEAEDEGGAQIEEEEALASESEYLRRRVDNIRTDFAESLWDARQRFPTQPSGSWYASKSDRIEAHIDKRRLLSPLRCEVLRQEVILRGNGSYKHLGGIDGGRKRYSTFHSFFMDTYRDASDPVIDISSELKRSWTGDNAASWPEDAQENTHDASQDPLPAKSTDCSAFRWSEEDLRGELGYYAEYERFNTSRPDDDNFEESGNEKTESTDGNDEDDEECEGRKGGNNTTTTTLRYTDSAMAYGPTASVSGPEMVLLARGSAPCPRSL